MLLPCSYFQNGPNRRHTGKVGATEVVRKETTIVQGERKVTVDRRIEASTASAEAKISQHADNEKSVIKNVSMPQDTQDMYEVDFLEVGSDGHEDVCHTCGLHGKLLCCDGCPISVHLKCIEPLVLRLPQKEEDWYCPVCLSLETAREAAEAEKARMLAAREAAEAEKVRMLTCTSLVTTVLSDIVFSSSKFNLARCCTCGCQNLTISFENDVNDHVERTPCIVVSVTFSVDVDKVLSCTFFGI